MEGAIFSNLNRMPLSREVFLISNAGTSTKLCPGCCLLGEPKQREAQAAAAAECYLGIEGRRSETGEKEEGCESLKRCNLDTALGRGFRFLFAYYLRLHVLAMSDPPLSISLVLKSCPLSPDARWYPAPCRVGLRKPSQLRTRKNIIRAPAHVHPAHGTSCCWRKASSPLPARSANWLDGACLGPCSMYLGRSP